MAVWQSYVSILYLKMPPGFKIILRGQEVQHHNLTDDLMFTQELTYRPQSGAEHVTKEADVRGYLFSLLAYPVYFSAYHVC